MNDDIYDVVFTFLLIRIGHQVTCFQLQVAVITCGTDILACYMTVVMDFGIFRSEGLMTCYANSSIIMKDFLLMSQWFIMTKNFVNSFPFI
jgi:hypothetical protein